VGRFDARSGACWTCVRWLQPPGTPLHERLTIVTNIAAPYRDGVFRELQSMFDVKVYLLARDEPGRSWRERTIPYRYNMAPALQLPGGRTSWYLPLPTWLFQRGHIVVAGFGLPALLTAAARPRSTLVWSEATAATERNRSRFRTRLRRWMIDRSRGAVAVGRDSTAYLQELGATNILMLPNVLDATPISRPSSELANHGRSGVVLSHVGDWSVAKGADLTASIFRILSEHFRSFGTPVELLIAGRIVDVAVPEGATHFGYLPHDQVWDTLRRFSAQFLLLMSRRDTWGFVVAEAMAAGIVPIASANVGSARDLLISVSADLVAQRPDDAAAIVCRLHADQSEMASIIAALHEIAESRTSRWAAECFRSDLVRLQQPVLSRR
jgi:glycosyltransferase involved in cell wall biosynthesis